MSGLILAKMGVSLLATCKHEMWKHVQATRVQVMWSVVQELNFMRLPWACQFLKNLLVYLFAAGCPIQLVLYAFFHKYSLCSSSDVNPRDQITNGANQIACVKYLA